MVYLIRFDYDHYCQGYETATEWNLVYASSFDDACQKIVKSGKFYRARDFVNLTLT